MTQVFNKLENYWAKDTGWHFQKQAWHRSVWIRPVKGHESDLLYSPKGLLCHLMGHALPTNPFSQAFSSFHIQKYFKLRLKPSSSWKAWLVHTPSSSHFWRQATDRSPAHQQPHQALPSCMPLLEPPSIAWLICYTYINTLFLMRLSFTFLRFT